MARRKASNVPEAEAPAVVQAEQPVSESPGSPPAQETPQGAAGAPRYANVPAPEKGERGAFTIDNRTGYRKEDSPDGRRRQIRFANRPDGQKPDDELLAPVREQKPVVSWTAREKAWQARKNQDGFEAIDSADQKLAEIGRNRTQEPQR